MSAIPASVIVVSRHRSAALQRCLVGLMQQDHPNFEVIVVADPDGIATSGAISAKLVPFDQPNISAARNAGLAVASGAVVAFIDDDAVAEPSWLSRLVEVFENLAVVAATGFVRGRNGISYQWRAAEVDNYGHDHPFAVDGPTLRSGTRLRAVKTQGTNCAFRRDTLLAIGGFDPAFRFFLDEADVNLRMADLGLTAVLPKAQVHHGYEASARRRADRVPLSLHEIAASTAVFLCKHAADVDIEGEWQSLLHRETDRVAKHRKARRINRAQAAALLASLAAGWLDGLERAFGNIAAILATDADLVPIESTGPRRGQVLTGRSWQRKKLMYKAMAAVAAGQIVTVICLSATARAHHVQFQKQGYWLQAGGLFGRSERDGRRLQFSRFSNRITEETARISPFRPVT